MVQEQAIACLLGLLRLLHPVKDRFDLLAFDVVKLQLVGSDLNSVLLLEFFHEAVKAALLELIRCELWLRRLLQDLLNVDLDIIKHSLLIEVDERELGQFARCLVAFLVLWRRFIYDIFPVPVHVGVGGGLELPNLRIQVTVDTFAFDFVERDFRHFGRSKGLRLDVDTLGHGLVNQVRVLHGRYAVSLDVA